MRKNRRKNRFAAIFSQRWLQVNALCLFLFAGLALALIAWFKSADYFRITQIVIREKDDIANGESVFAYLKGKNIFVLDLEREAARIAVFYPSYRKIRLTRYLPDCILVDFLRRIPEARVRANKSYYIDKEGCLFDQPGDVDLLRLPVITGLERRVNPARPAGMRASKEIRLSLLVIRSLRADRALDAFRIVSLDAGAPGNFAFVLRRAADESAGKGGRPGADAGGIEVRVGDDNIAAKMHILSTVLTQMRATAENIKYIDLRFREPVIKFKDMEKFAGRQ